MKAVSGRLVPALLFLWAGMDVAQAAPLPTVTDPALQQQQQQRDRQYFQQQQQPTLPRVDGESVIEGAVPEGGNLPASSVSFVLTSVHFNASAFLDAASLDAITRDYVGKTVTFNDINQMLARINALYAARGIISARALVLPQTIDKGVLDVRLVEGKLGKLRVEGNARVRDSFFGKRLPLSEGQVIDTDALRKSLLFLNRSSDLRAQAGMEAGAGMGESDVVLKVVEPQPVQLEMFADNNGTESTGSYRGGLVANVFSPLGLDDRLAMSLDGAEGAFNGSLDYSLPVNRLNGRVGLNYAKGKIDIVKGPFQSLGITGDSSQLGLSFNQPLLRTDHWSLDAYVRGSQIDSSTQITGFDLSEYRILRADSGLRVTNYGSGYQWSLDQGITRTSVRDLFDVKEKYGLYVGSANLTVLVYGKWVSVLNAGWQYTNEVTLPSALLFQVGGVSSVRGYQSGVLAAARGFYASNELQYQWRPTLVPFLFLDQGMVKDDSMGGEGIRSAGVGIRWRYGRYFSGEAAWGQTFMKVVPDQDEGQLHVRLSLSWPGL